MTVFVSSIQRLSVPDSGQETDGPSGDPKVAPGGSVVAFATAATNMGPDDTNGVNDLFFRNLATGALFRAGWGAHNGFLPQFSGDGSALGFLGSDGVTHVFAADTATGATVEVSASATGDSGNGNSDQFSFSRDGRLALFSSYADNLTAGDTGGYRDIFLKNTATGEIVRVSTDGTGVQGDGDSSNAVLSPDGGRVLFSSFANSLAAGPHDLNGDVAEYFLKDLATGAIARLPGGDLSFDPVFSPDGSHLLFTSRDDTLVSGDNDGKPDLFYQDLATGTVTMLGNGDLPIRPQFSSDGSQIVFVSSSGALVAGDTNNVQDIFAQNLSTGVITRLSVDAAGQQGGAASLNPILSPDGTILLFTSGAAEFASGDDDSVSDFYLKDLASGALTRVATSITIAPCFSPESGKIFFGSAENNLVAGDTDNSIDYFIREIVSGATVKVLDGTGVSGLPVMTPDWSRIVFVSDSGALGPDDTNNAQDVYAVILGNDGIVMGTEGNDRLHGTAAQDKIFGLGGSDRIDGGTFSDKIEGGAGLDTIHGGDGNDVINGGAENDTLYGDAGNDTIHGNEHNDSIDGGAGDDKLYGDDGDDTLAGGDGIDFMGGGGGADELHGGAQDDTIYGNDGNDRLYGDGENDVLYGGDGNDFAQGGLDADLLYGNSGIDDLRGGGGGDTLYGGSGNDTMAGDDGVTDADSGNDILYGEAGNDTMHGGLGGDTLNGGAGADTLYGDGGADTFAFDTAAAGSIDRIRDFSLDDGDRLDVAGLLTGFDPLTDAITKFVKITTNGDISALYIDRNGADAGAVFEKMAVLDANHALNVQDMYDNGQILA